MKNKDQLVKILRSEVKPALGCTGPVLIALSTAVSRDAVGGTPRNVKLLLDKDSYIKNTAVGIPGIDARGIPIAAALGAMVGDASAELEVLRKVTSANAEKAKAFLANVKVDIKWNFNGIGLYVESWVETERGTGHSLIAKNHTNIVFAEANGNLIKGTYPSSFSEIVDDSHDPIRQYTVQELFEFSASAPIKELSFLRDAVTLNKNLSAWGLHVHAGEDFGNAILNIPFSNPILRAKSLTAAASDARMAGESASAMSCATSGNVGITASLPLISMAEELGSDEIALLRSIAFSFLLTIQIKSYIGRYSAFCACAIAASIGVAGGMTMLLGGNAHQCGAAIRNVIGSTLGVLCDGAKHGCALKLSTGAGAAIESAYLAMSGSAIRGGDGVVCKTADETIRLMGKMAHEGMKEADEKMCRLIYERDQADHL